MSPRPLLFLALSLQARLDELREYGSIPLSGHGLDLAAVVAVARFVMLMGLVEHLGDRRLITAAATTVFQS